MKKIVLLRVGIDSGSGGMLGPIFENGKFEFTPIPTDNSSERLGRTYANTKGRYGRMLIEYFPPQIRQKMLKHPKFLHFDPEFKTKTYGDPTLPKRGLKKLETGDWLVFYAGLKGWPYSETLPSALYIIGYFVVEEAGFYPDLKRKGVIGKFKQNWHILNNDPRKKDKLILVKGGHGSRLLKKAIKISADKRAKDKGGHPVFVLDHKMFRYFGTFTKLNAIQRSIPRWVRSEFSEKAIAFLKTLK